MKDRQKIIETELKATTANLTELKKRNQENTKSLEAVLGFAFDSYITMKTSFENLTTSIRKSLYYVG